MALPALTLFAVTVTGVVAPWMVFALVFASRSTSNAIDNPARQSFVIEMVGPDRVVNAVSLNSVLVHAARMFGPAIAGMMILPLGVEPCFLVNAASFGAMIVALRSMNPAQLAPAARRTAPPRRGCAPALRYVARTPALAIPLAMMALVGTLGFNFQVLLPLLARFAFEGGAGAYTALAVAMGVGSVVGRARDRQARDARRAEAADPGRRARASALLALVAAAAPTLAVAVAAARPARRRQRDLRRRDQLDCSSSRPRPRCEGRVMALYSIVFLGSTPIGGPLAGWLSEAAGPRAGLVLAGVAALRRSSRRRRRL